MFPPTPQSALQYPSGNISPLNINWSVQYDYQGGNSIVYTLWTPTFKGIAAGIGYISLNQYDGGGKLVSITWAVTQSGGNANPTAIWANRTTLTYA